jgi:hypothetical protein
MDYRWVIGITLWTFLSGPIFSGPRGLPPVSGRTAAMSHVQRISTAAAKSVPAVPQHTPEKK